MLCEFHHHSFPCIYHLYHFVHLLSGMQVLCDARDKLDIPWENPTSQLAANQAVMFHSGILLDVDQFYQFVPIIAMLWQDRAIRRAYDRRREFQIVSIVIKSTMFENQ